MESRYPNLQAKALKWWALTKGKTRKNGSAMRRDKSNWKSSKVNQKKRKVQDEYSMIKGERLHVQSLWKPPDTARRRGY